MKTLFRSAAVVALAAFATPVLAQTAADPNANQAQAEARAEILAGLTLTNVDPLNFGSVIVLGAGSVTVASDGSNAVCDANLVCSGATTPASFTVEGSADKAVSINLQDVSLATNELQYDDGVTVHSIDLSAIETNSKLDSNTQATDPVTGLPAVDPVTGDPVMVQYDGVQLDGTGSGAFNVGGTIDIADGQTPGLYTGTVDVTVNYN